jgi:hypothetical protein
MPVRETTVSGLKHLGRVHVFVRLRHHSRACGAI